MASSSIVSSWGHCQKRQKSSKGEDIISNLPDFIIAHILSFLPTKDAVRTCVLSRKWICLWTFITALLFQDRDPCYYGRTKIIRQRFLQSVNRVLLHLNNLSIQSFTLIMMDKHDSSQVNDWISAVLNRNVKKLWIHSNRGQVLPSYSLLKFASLEQLGLMLGGINSCAIRVPNSIFFSSLTVLKLSGITFTCDYSNHSKNLCLHFPVLKIYKTNFCIWKNVKSVTVKAPLLEVIYIRYNVLPRAHKLHTEIKFCASHLKIFRYRGPVFANSDTILLDVSAVDLASIEVQAEWSETAGYEHEMWGNIVCKFIKQFNSKVKHFEFLWYEDLKPAINSFLNLTPFEMLNHLELGYVTAEFLLAFLVKTPFLKTLIIQGVIKKELLEFVPDCFHSNLEVVKFECFGGHRYEMSFAKFVMKKAEVLKRITFGAPHRFSASINPVKLKLLKEKIVSFRKPFTTVEFLSNLFWGDTFPTPHKKFPSGF